MQADELHAVLLQLGGGGKALTRGAVANLVRLADDNGNGSIDFSEFEAIVRRIA